MGNSLYKMGSYINRKKKLSFEGQNSPCKNGKEVSGLSIIK